MMKPIKFIFSHKVAFFFILSLLILITLHAQILSSIGGFLVVQEGLTNASIIQAMGWSRTERVNYAITLFKDDYANYLYFAGNDEGLPFSFEDYGEVVREYAANFDVPQKAIIVGPSTASTFEEAMSLRRLMINDERYNSALIISSPYHMKRVKLTYQKIFPDNINLTFHHVPWNKSVNKKEWWKDEDSAAMVVLEYVKLAYYFFKNRI